MIGFFILLSCMMLLGVWVGLGVQSDPGYLLVSYQQWVLQMELWWALVLLSVGFIVFYILLRSLLGGKHLTGKVWLWFGGRRVGQARRYTTQGLLELAEGHWASAEKQLVKGARYNDNALLNYLAAAQSAHRQGAHDRRDNYLKQAHLGTPDSDVAVGITQAQLQLEHGQTEQALATLIRLRSIAPKHAYVLKLLKCLYLEVQDWDLLLELIPELRKQKVLSSDEIQQLEQRAWIYRLDIAGDKDGVAHLQSVWQLMPKPCRKDMKIIENYVEKLTQNQAEHEVEPIIRATLKQNWHDKLAACYGCIQGADVGKQLKYAEAWLSSHPNSEILYLTLGRLSLRNQLWGKARSYFESSIAIRGTAACYAELARLLERLGEQARSMECYRLGLAQQNLKLPTLPLPSALEQQN